MRAASTGAPSPAGRRRIFPVSRSLTSASPPGRNAMPHGVVNPVATSRAWAGASVGAGPAVTGGEKEGAAVPELVLVQPATATDRSNAAGSCQVRRLRSRPTATRSGVPPAGRGSAGGDPVAVARRCQRRRMRAPGPCVRPEWPRSRSATHGFGCRRRSQREGLALGAARVAGGPRRRAASGAVPGRGARLPDRRARDLARGDRHIRRNIAAQPPGPGWIVAVPALFGLHPGA